MKIRDIDTAEVSRRLKAIATTVAAASENFAAIAKVMRQAAFAISDLADAFTEGGEEE